MLQLGGRFPPDLVKLFKEMQKRHGGRTAHHMEPALKVYLEMFIRTGRFKPARKFAGRTGEPHGLLTSWLWTDPEQPLLRPFETEIPCALRGVTSEIFSP